MKNSSNSERIIITGVGGFIGGALMGKLKRYEPVGVALHLKDHIRGMNVIEADLTKEDKVKEIFDQYQPTTVFHFAALSDPRLNQQHPEMARVSNFVTAENIINNLHKDTHLIFPSSDKVFDGSESYPDESSPVKPLSYYGELKCQCEDLVRKKVRRHHMVRLAAVHNFERYTKVYKGTDRGAFLDQALTEIKGGKEISVFGATARCFTRLEQLIFLYEAFIQDTNYGTYNVGSKLTYYYDRIVALCEEENIPWEGKIKRIESNANPPIQNMNTEKVRKTFGIDLT